MTRNSRRSHPGSTKGCPDERSDAVPVLIKYLLAPLARASLLTICALFRNLTAHS